MGSFELGIRILAESYLNFVCSAGWINTYRTFEGFAELAEELVDNCMFCPSVEDAIMVQQGWIPM